MASVTLFGRDVPLVELSDFDLGDLNDCENFFGASFNTEEINSRKLSAILFVSLRRVEPNARPEDIRKLKVTELEALNEQLTRWLTEDEGADAGPPSAGVEEPTSSDADSSGAVDIPSVPDPSSSGQPSSDTGFTSDRLTSVA